MDLSDLWLQNFEQSWTQAEKEITEIRQYIDKTCQWTTEIVPNQQAPLEGKVAPMCDLIDYQD